MLLVLRNRTLFSIKINIIHHPIFPILTTGAIQSLQNLTTLPNLIHLHSLLTSRPRIRLIIRLVQRPISLPLTFLKSPTAIPTKFTSLPQTSVSLFLRIIRGNFWLFSQINQILQFLHFIQTVIDHL